MVPQLAWRSLRSIDPKCLAKFAWIFGVKGLVAMEKYRKRMKQGVYFPPFLFISITNQCNLRCQGCWVDVDRPTTKLDLATLNRLIYSAREYGNICFGILGGEPFMHEGLMDLLAEHRGCYFQILTNGQFITEKVARQLRQLANVTPVVSIEGLKQVADVRRGSNDVYNRSVKGLLNCLDQKIITGVASSVCQSNIDQLMTDDWLKELIRLGAHYVWYYSYRPAGPRMTAELALRPEQQLALRRFIVERRSQFPIAIVDSYFDHQGRALCPMVPGISHHINPAGYVEPCPVLQFGAENINDPGNPADAIRDSKFLQAFRDMASSHTRGCILLERPDLVAELVTRIGAKDTTLRQTALKELAMMRSRPSQWLPGQEIPEAHWMYRLVKRFWFHDYGTYRNLPATAADEVKTLLARSNSEINNARIDPNK